MKNKRSSIILILNNKGEYALQRRAAHDTSYPLHWDFSAAGGIDDKETPDEAAARELKEELGIEGKLTYVGEYSYMGNEAQDQLYVYRLNYDGQFSPDSNEVDEVRFFTVEKIREMLESDEKFHPEFPFLFQQGIIN